MVLIAVVLFHGARTSTVQNHTCAKFHANIVSLLLRRSVPGSKNITHTNNQNIGKQRPSTQMVFNVVVFHGARILGVKKFSLQPQRKNLYANGF